MITFIALICVGIALRILWDATQRMNLSAGLNCWINNGIVLASFGVVGYVIGDYALLAYTSNHTLIAVALGIFTTPFILMSGLAVTNIAQNGR